MEHSIYALEHKQTGIDKILNPDQLAVLEKECKKIPKWCDKTLIRTYQLKFACGIAGYKELLHKNIPLPSLRTLRRKLENWEFSSGHCDEIFQFLAFKVGQFKKESDKDCLIVVDEISITPKLCYDNSSGSFIGNVTLPGHDSSQIATHALVFMLAGICQRWKQTIDFYYTGKSTDGTKFKSILVKYIEKAHEIGLAVRGIVSDMGAANQAMWRSFGINAGRFSIPQNKCPHPLDSTEHLYFFHDASHAFKNLKEGVLNNVSISIRDKYVKLYNLPTNAASAKHIEYLLEIQKDSDLQLAPKLRDEYLNTKSHFQKMRVKSASHVLSHHVSTVLQFIAEEQGKPAFITSSWLVGRFVKWFAIITARNLALALSKKKETKFLETLNFLNEFIDLMGNLRFGAKGEWKPFQKGVIITTKSYIELATFLIEVRDYNFVFGGRFTQDCIENLFSVLRMKNCVLNAIQLKNNLKLISVSHYMRRISNTNYDEDDREFPPDFLSTVKNLKKEELNHTDMTTPSGIDPNFNNNYNITINNIELNCLNHIAGYLIKSIVKTQ